MTVGKARQLETRWPPARPAAPPGDDEVLVWVAPVDASTARVSQLEAALAPDELARVERCGPSLAGRRYVVRRGLLRGMLGVYLGCAPEAVPIVYGRRGKPALGPPYATTGLQFNLADTGELVVYAVCRGHDVGVDIEQVRERPNAIGLAGGLLLCTAGCLNLRDRFQCWRAQDTAYQATPDCPCPSTRVKLLSGAGW